MTKSYGYAAQTSQSPLAPLHFERRDPGPHDVLVEILYCGVCHSDVHQARDEWGGSIFPMVPGHEMVGRVIQIGDKVTKFAIGDFAGVGCMVDSCRQCSPCHEGYEQFCEAGVSASYNSYEQDKKTPTYGGYANNIVVDEAFTLKINPNLDLARTAPLLCAGITTYSPLKRWQVQKGQKVGIVGLGGLGHMAVKFAKAFGATVVLFTTSASKFEDAKCLGADEVILATDAKAMAANRNSLDLILDTVSASHDINMYLQLLRLDGVMVFVGLPTEDLKLNTMNIVIPRRQIAGSLIGGIAETQEMLDYCAEHNILSDIEIIPIQKINEAYERMLKGDVKYRFVIDMRSLMGED